MVMIFGVERVRNYLLKHGEVYTFRKNMHKTGNDWINTKRCGKKIADVTIELEKVIHSEYDLNPYISKSSFETLDQWIAEIFRLNPKLRRVHGYLYHVKIRK